MWTRKANIVLLSLLLPMQSFAAEKLIYTLDLIRHGDRTPVYMIPASHNEWKEGLGQLTTTGMQQEFNLGVTLHQRYIEQEHLLSAQYQAGTVYVRASDVDRTLMSAESLLMGLYPAASHPSLPFAMQPVPVHTAPPEVDTVIIHQPDPKELAARMQQYVYDTAEWKQKEKSLQPLFKHWSDATGLPITSLKDLYFADTIHINQLHHLPQPAGLSDEDINTILDAGNFVFTMQLKAAPVAALLDQQLINYIKTAIQQHGDNNQLPVKYTLLSAHDTTVAAVMTLLGAPVSVQPPYASDLNFSLYQTSNNNYVVRVTYNGAPVVIPQCGGTECSLAQFAKVAG